MVTTSPVYNAEKREDNSFENITVGIFGGTSYINSYVEEIEKRNGKILYTDSDVLSKIDNIVNQSDIIIIPIFQTSHAKAKMAKERAKANNKPFKILRSNGRSNFVKEVQEAIAECYFNT